MNVMLVGAPPTVVRLMIAISLAVTVVLVKSLVVVLWTLVPVEMDTPEVLIESLTVGIAVPVAFFHTLNVAVPLGASEMFHAEIVQA